MSPVAAPDDDILTYTFADAIKMAGHACPTVAGVYLMTLRALDSLYGESTPERGAISVAFPAAAQEGVTGVMANVVTQITGATTDTGFKGLGGHFDRRGLLEFDAAFDGDIMFRRVDTDEAIVASYDASSVPPSPDMFPALRHAIQTPLAAAHQKNDFMRLWQDRVQRIFEASKKGGLITLRTTCH